MNKKSKFVFYSFLSLVSFLLVELVYIDSTQSMTDDMRSSKNEVVKLVALPDLAISTEASYVRHRSLNNIGDIYKDDGSLREYFVSTYAFSSSHIINNMVKNEQ